MRRLAFVVICLVADPARAILLKGKGHSHSHTESKNEKDADFSQHEATPDPYLIALAEADGDIPKQNALA